MYPIPFDAPFVPDTDEVRYAADGLLPRRDLDAVLHLLPDGSFDPLF